MTFNTCPISPLKLTADVCEVIMTAARNGATVNVLSMGMAGGSTPVNLAGALVVHNCEALGLVSLANHSAGRQVHLWKLLNGNGFALRRGCSGYAGTGRAQRRGRGYGPLLQAALLGGGRIGGQ